MKRNLLFIFVFIVSINIKAQVGYHIQLPIGPGNSNYIFNTDSIYLSNGATGKSNMMHINPNTKAWEYLNVPYLPNYGSPVIKDKNNGLILIAGSNSIQVTSDGWQTVTTSTASYPYVNKCPAGYYGHYNVGSSTTLVHSSNGLNWTNATMPGLFTILAARNYGNKVVALSASSSFSTMVSTDGGLTYSGIANTATFTTGFLDFYMPSIDTFIVVFNNLLCKSFNAGLTWTNTPIPGGPYTKVAFKNKNEFALQLQNAPPTFSYTTDGGATWLGSVNPMPVLGVGQILYCNNYYYMFPWFRTNDYGATWEHFLPNMAQYAYGVDFNGNKGLLGLQNGMYSYSTDKGRSFNHYLNTLSSNQDMMATKVLSNGNFLAGDRKGQVFTSIDNGQTWVQKNTEPTLTPNAIRFLTSVNENTVVMTRGGLPVVSVDASASYSVVTYGTSGGTHIQALKPNGQMMDLRALSNGWEMRTFDITGATTIIATYTSSPNESVGAFYMTTNTDGYILTRDNTAKINKIYKTTDGGLTFSPKTSIGQITAGSSAYMNSIISGIPLFHHFSDTIILTANFDNYYHISYDGATTWNTITPGFVPGNTTYGNMIYRMNFFTYNSYLAITGDAFGPLGLYLNTTGATGPSIGINELNFDNKKDNLIVFPNPSQNGNLVSLLNLDEEIEVNIFNINGQLVKSLTTNSGSFTVENLSLGLYIVQVKEKDKPVRTAKLVIQ